MTDSATDRSERAPLLKKANDIHDDPDRPLPMDQMALLMLARFIEPVAFFSMSVLPTLNADGADGFKQIPIRFADGFRNWNSSWTMWFLGRPD